MPELPTTAIPELLLLHTPPEDASAKVVVAPGQTTPVPVMVPATGSGLTVATTAVRMLLQVSTSIFQW